MSWSITIHSSEAGIVIAFGLQGVILPFLLLVYAVDVGIVMFLCIRDVFLNQTVYLFQPSLPCSVILYVILYASHTITYPFSSMDKGLATSYIDCSGAMAKIWP